MAQIARPEADKVDTARNARNEIAELGKQITDKAAGQAENVARSSFQSARQAVDAGAEVGRKIAGRAEVGMTEINQSLVELLNQQARAQCPAFPDAGSADQLGQGGAAPERVPAHQLAAGGSVRPALCRGQPSRHDLGAVDRSRLGHESLRPTCSGRLRLLQGMALA